MRAALRRARGGRVRADRHRSGRHPWGWGDLPGGISRRDDQGHERVRERQVGSRRVVVLRHLLRRASWHAGRPGL